MTPSKPAGGPARPKSKASAPAHPLTRSPVRTEQVPPPGACVVLYLHSPREKHWGFLLQMHSAGLWLRGIELESFDAWAREQASPDSGHMGLTTFFVPYLRLDKVVLDERVGPVASLKERYEAITGRHAEEAS